MTRALLTDDEVDPAVPDRTSTGPTCCGWEPDGSVTDDPAKNGGMSPSSGPASASSGSASTSSPPSSVSRRGRFAAAVAAVVVSHRAIAAAHAEHALLVEEARIAGFALHTQDSFASNGGGGPQWSSDQIVQRQVVLELAVALHLSEPDARRLVDTCEGLTGPFTKTRDALASGRVSYRHTETLIHRSHPLPREALSKYENTVLPWARRVTVQRLDTIARACVEEAQPRTDNQRHTDAVTNRRVYLEPGSDGMAYLTLYTAAVEAVAIHNRASDMARSAKHAGDPRTLTQLKVDVLTDLMLNGNTHTPRVAPGIRARVNVTVPALTLLGRDHHGVPDPDQSSGPANLEGFGPIDRHTALTITRDAHSFTRVLTDPATGTVLSYGRQRYKPPADLDELIRLTHTECTFPTPCQPSTTTDLDHTIAWGDGGTTAYDNLSPLCTTHHKVKHHTEWTIRQTPGENGRPPTITWTSPAGYHYTIDPTPLTKPIVQFTQGTDRTDSKPDFADDLDESDSESDSEVGAPPF
ncbi:HNH endonuclease [Subtercola sp. PAMC28395]|uniref:HNH endonuclease signature motif containing protein n=1 Tax=Subtercola sp. PAMC28395 TaxID=2846775 RepID=UPI001C0BC9F8|nr:HNH endonuclease signature motif containing protein [Subtercola sp. PAMC28395]QWT24140.1 HNH endonuclease [Subtercola sp. PAMC28395]